MSGPCLGVVVLLLLCVGLFAGCGHSGATRPKTPTVAYHQAVPKPPPRHWPSTELGVPLAPLDFKALPNSGWTVTVAAVSCWRKGYCVAGGGYKSPIEDWFGNHQSTPFLAVERHGHWGRAFDVPGVSSLNHLDTGSNGSNSAIGWVHCFKGGYCSAGGRYSTSLFLGSGTGLFVVNEVRGEWYRASLLPGLGHLNVQKQAWFTTTSCTSAGNCDAHGIVNTGIANRLFVVREVNGVWRRVYLVRK